MLMEVLSTIAEAGADAGKDLTDAKWGFTEKYISKASWAQSDDE